MLSVSAALWWSEIYNLFKISILLNHTQRKINHTKCILLYTIFCSTLFGVAVFGFSTHRLLHGWNEAQSHDSRQCVYLHTSHTHIAIYIYVCNYIYIYLQIHQAIKGLNFCMALLLTSLQGSWAFVLWMGFTNHSASVKVVYSIFLVLIAFAFWPVTLCGFCLLLMLGQDLKGWHLNASDNSQLLVEANLDHLLGSGIPGYIPNHLLRMAALLAGSLIYWQRNNRFVSRKVTCLDEFGLLLVHQTCTR